MGELYQSGWKPVGVRRSWDRTSMDLPSTERLLGSWGDLVGGKMVEAVAWFDGEDDLKVLVADYDTGKRLVARRNQRAWNITFDLQPGQTVAP